MFKNFQVIVDTVQKSKLNNIVVNSNDLKTFKLSLTINQFNKPIDLTGATVRIAIVKPDKKTVFQDCTITDPKIGTCEVVLNTQAFIISGVYIAEVMIYYGADTVAVTGRFSYSVAKGILDNSTAESTNDWQSINQAIVDAEGILIDLRENGTGIDAEARSQLTNTAVEIVDINNTNPSLNAVWKSPVMPDTIRGNGLVPTSYNPDVQLAALMDPLVDGEYVTKRSIGKSSSRHVGETLSSEIFDVWCYEFTPKYPEKTILITSLIHGNEYTAFYWATQFADLLVNKYKGDPHLEYLRRSVRIVMVPIVNPYGHLVQTRENINDVDCSRNFDYNWGVSTDEYNQGTAPWTENESKIIRDLMDSLPDDTVASLDYHTTLSEGDTHYMLYFPRWMENDVQDYLAMIDQLIKPGETTAFANATLTNWGVYQHGFNAANPEFKNGLYGSTRSSVEMTRAMNFFGNMVFLAAKKPFRGKGTTISSDELMTVNYDHRTDGGVIPFGYNANVDTGLPDYTSQGTKTSVRFGSKSEGTIKAFGDVVVVADQDCEISIMSHLYQLGSPDFDFAKTKDDESNSKILNVKAGEEKVFPLRSAILCHKTNILAANNTNTAMRTREIVFQLRTKINVVGGTASIKFMDMMLEFVPSTNGRRFSRYRSNPARYTYPTGQETVYKY